MVSASETTHEASVQTSLTGDGILTFTFAGRLDAHTITRIWEDSRQALVQQRPKKVIVNAAQINYCDGAGIAMLLDLQCKAGNVPVEIRELPAEYQRLLELFAPRDFPDAPLTKPIPKHLPEEVGQAAAGLWQDFAVLVTFVGELVAALAMAARHPRQVRWCDALLAAENAGVNALPIVALISFLIGLIMGFQSAVPMRQFGVEIFVADLVSLAMLRELGPLMTAIIMAGRSGSAFAAEIGTMKVNEEINALTTMGLDPVRFLVVTRVLAAVVVMPMLVLFSNLMGLVGGAVVLKSFGYPLVTYVNQVLGAVHMRDLLGGLAKSFVFGILVAGIGCLRGLQTKTGASAVGLSTTRAVVSGIILIVMCDGVFSVVFFYLGI